MRKHLTACVCRNPLFFGIGALMLGMAMSPQMFAAGPWLGFNLGAAIAGTIRVLGALCKVVSCCAVQALNGVCGVLTDNWRCTLRYLCRQPHRFTLVARQCAALTRHLRLHVQVLSRPGVCFARLML
jgi:hypothetical protein